MEPLRKECGSYMPGFFRMKLEFPFNDSRLVLYNLPRQDQASFFHEYIHFLQDITTFWGLNNAYVYSEYIHWACNTIYKQSKGEIHLPIKNKYDNSNVASNKWVVEQTIGDYEERDNLFIINYEKKDVYPSFKSSYLKKLKKILLTIQGGRKIEFGARAIMESMAYIIEHRISPGGKAPKEYPYCSAEYLARKIYATFADDDLRLIALCDMSLMFNEPGKIFVETIEDYKQKRELPTPEDIYERFYSMPILNMGQHEMLAYSYYNFAEIVSNRLKIYLNNNPYKFSIGLNGREVFVQPLLANEFYQFNKAINNLVGFGIRIRLDIPFFYLNLARGGTIYNNSWLRFSMNSTGIPLIEDINHDFFKIPSSVISEDAMGFFFAIEQIYNTFEKGQDICEMIDICSKSKIDSPVDERCYFTPWMRSNDYKLCPYAFLWRHWNLKDRVNVIFN